ncbi:hypothetical protein G3V81_23660, partial [Escherichia coli]|nr:hypothetical protein [Escherichia coli]
DAKIYKSNAKKAFTAADCWANGHGDPLRDVETHMDAVRNNVGLRPNIITMGASVMTLLKFHPVIQAAIGANERKIITTDILKELFGVDEIVVGNPVSLGKDGKTADLWKDNLMGHYVTPPQGGATSADENEPSFGYTFRRKGMPVIDQYDAVGGKVHHCRYTDIYKVVVVGSDAGFLLSGLKGGA